MSSLPHSSTHQRRADQAASGARTIAQTTCLLLGGALLLAGIVGFVVDSSFTSGAAPEGDLLLGLEVNAWHNIAHIATGLILLLGAPRARSALTALLVFGIGYIAVTAWGFVDGESVFRLLAINDADNWFHLALTVVSLGAFAMAGGLAALSGKEHEQARDRA